MSSRDEYLPLAAPAPARLADSFGDGEHPSTALAAEELDAALAAGHPTRVLDAGSGSGILAERALAAGAREVVAVDRDRDAAVQSRRRVPSARVWQRDLRAGIGDLGTFDVVVANLHLPELVACVGPLAAATAPGGRIVATGALLVFAARMERALRACGVGILRRRARSGWCAVVGEAQ